MSDSGERELVLGNKQLLAIFFVAALLCGVFFAVGYVVGGNSAKSVPTTTQTAEVKRDEPQAQSTAADGSGMSGASSASGSDSPLPSSEPRISDTPAATGSQPSSIPPAPAPAPPVTKAPASTAAPANAAPLTIAVPEKGASYVQVIAITRPKADDLVKSFREAGLPAILAESSKPGLYEVLIGPYHSGPIVAEAKRKVTELGFGDTRVHKF
jgi:hypothetical protein